MQFVTCKHCGWVYFAQTRAQIEKQIQDFITFYEAATPEVRECYGDAPTVKEYEKCMLCRRAEFRPFKEGDCPDGVTISGVIYEQ